MSQVTWSGQCTSRILLKSQVEIISVVNILTAHQDRPKIPVHTKSYCLQVLPWRVQMKPTKLRDFTSNIRKAKSLSLSWAWCIWVKKYPNVLPCRDERWRYGRSTHFVLLPLGRRANHQPVHCTLMRVFQIKVLKTVRNKRNHKLKRGDVPETKPKREKTRLRRLAFCTKQCWHKEITFKDNETPTASWAHINRALKFPQFGKAPIL